MIIMDFLYLNDCNISDDLKTKLSDLTLQDEVAFLRCAKVYSAGNTAVMKKLNDLQRLAVALKAFEFTHKKYEEKGIEDSIFFDTLSDLGIWCRNNHNKGLENYNWIRHHVSFKLFKLGRLQFQIYECKNPTMRYAKLPFKYGDTVLNVHIPACGKLDYEECKCSLAYAVAFFDKNFPEIKWDYFLCESWLVYGKNMDFMEEDSNILKFTELFDINYSINYENQTFERLFGLKRPVYLRAQLKKLPENTSLQKRAKAYRLAGNRFGIGIATIKKQAVLPPENKAN